MYLMALSVTAIKLTSLFTSRNSKSFVVTRLKENYTPFKIYIKRCIQILKQTQTFVGSLEALGTQHKRG